jgi:hypothetical protein
MSDQDVKFVIETKNGKILSVWNNSKYSYTRILDWDTINAHEAKEFLSKFDDALSTGAKSKLVDIVINAEKETDIESLRQMIIDAPCPIAPFLREVIQYCRKHPQVSISEAIKLLMKG